MPGPTRPRRTHRARRGAPNRLKLLPGRPTPPDRPTGRPPIPAPTAPKRRAMRARPTLDPTAAARPPELHPTVTPIPHPVRLDADAAVLGADETAAVRRPTRPTAPSPARPDPMLRRPHPPANRRSATLAPPRPCPPTRTGPAVGDDRPTRRAAPVARRVPVVAAVRAPVTHRMAPVAPRAPVAHPMTVAVDRLRAIRPVGTVLRPSPAVRVVGDAVADATVGVVRRAIR